jgi:hypothetical protein
MSVIVGYGTTNQETLTVNGATTATSIPVTATANGHAANDVVVAGAPRNVTLNVKSPQLTPPFQITAPALVPLLQSAIRAAAPGDPAFAGATVYIASPSATQAQLAVVPGLSGASGSGWFAFQTAGTDTTASDLKLNAPASSAPAQFLVGSGTKGADGVPPNGNDLVTALGALDQIDLFNLLCIPRTALVAPGVTDSSLNPLSAAEAQMVISAAEKACSDRRAIFLMDTPGGVATYTDIQTWLASNDSLRSRNAALYYPRVQMPDPLNMGRRRSVGASGTAAGLCARIDAARGVWKAPAGTEATLANVSALDDVLTDAENGVLNPLAINCIRNFKVYGVVSWGARTLNGSDQIASEWKYLPVRRTALFIEESLFRGTKWVVFEPNDEPLWAQIRLNVGAFMHNLFRQGAFQGKTPREAYFVKCDSETTTQNDIDLGVVNIVVGFAPLKPAEFVIIQLQQMTGQIQV